MNYQHNFVQRDKMADFMFALVGVALCVLLGANALVVVARIMHRDDVARAVIRTFSRITGLFKLGRDGPAGRDRGADGSVRT